MKKILNDIEVDNVQKYLDIMEEYRSGKFGEEHLTLHEILTRAGEPNLLDQISLEELDILINNSFGIIKNIFVTKKNELIGHPENNKLVKKEKKV